MTYDLTDAEHELILAGLFELRITRLEDDHLCADLDTLAAKIGGDPGDLFYGAALNY